MSSGSWFDPCFFGGADCHEPLERTLHECEAFLGAVMDSEPQCVKLLAADGSLVRMNKAGLEMIQADSLDQVKGRSVYPLIAPEFREAFRKVTEEVFEGKAGKLEFQMVGLRGRVLWLETDAVPLRNRENRIVALLGITRDVTGRKLAENSLRESEERFRRLAEAAPILIWMSGTEKLCRFCTYFNRQWLEFTGRTMEEELGCGWVEGVHPEDYERCRDTYITAFDRREPFVMEYRLRRYDGEYRWIYDSGGPSILPGGEFVGYIGSAIDISDRRQVEEDRDRLINELQGLVTIVSNSQREWQTTFDSITDLIFLSNLDFTITRVNRAAEKVLDMPLIQTLGKKCHELIHGTAIHPDFCYGCKTAKTAKMTVTEMYEPHLNRHIEVRVIPRFGKQDQLVGLIHVIRDMTEHKKLEEQLAQAQKMEAVGQLAGGVAHDFNNILTSIIGCGNLLQMKLGEGTPLATYINHILDASHKGASLVRGLLAFSRKEMFYPAPLDLNETIRELELFVRRTVTEDIELRMDLADEVMTVMADKTQIGQALISLVANARDAMPEGGLVHITTERFELEREFAQLYGSLPPGIYARISVSDSGTGIDEKTKERIFDPFFTTKEVGKGTGLGLSIVYGIIKQHNGHIMVDSTRGIGTTVHMYLPIVRADGDREEAKELPFVRGGNETILYAEDDAIVRNIVKDLLEEFGYEVIEAADGEDVVHKFIKHRDRISLLVLDVIMPGMNGKEAYDRIKNLQPGTKMLFISGYASDILQSRFIHEDGLHFLQKPVSPVKLLTKIRQLLDM